jgi:GNAT superfamily N-acetyltransferase
MLSSLWQNDRTYLTPEPFVNLDLTRLVHRMETAQALQSRSFLLETQRKNPQGSARALRGRWGFAHFFAEGHFLNQALALGLADPVSSRQLDRVESLLGKGGHPVVLELAPTADAELAGLLSARGYRIQAFQQVLARELTARDGLPSPVWDPRVQIRCIGADEMELWSRVVQAGFQDLDEPAAAEETAPGFSAEALGNRLLLATMEGCPAGAAVLGSFNRVAVLSGTSVLTRFRGLGAQRALVAARLRLALDDGCRWACSAVLPGTTSQGNLERSGFRVVYPKLELARGGRG